MIFSLGTPLGVLSEISRNAPAGADSSIGGT